MTEPISREQIRRAYLAGERLRAQTEGREWNEREAEGVFDEFLQAERYDALGVTPDVVDAGARILMRVSKISWDSAFPAQRAPWQKIMRDALVKVRDIKKASESKRSHGTRAKYNKDGCHCPSCKRSNVDYLADLDERKAAGNVPLVPSGPSRERLRALTLAGFNLTSLAEELGYASSSISDIASGHAKMVRPETEDDIRRLTQSKGRAQRSMQIVQKAS